MNKGVTEGDEDLELSDVEIEDMDIPISSGKSQMKLHESQVKISNPLVLDKGMFTGQQEAPEEIKDSAVKEPESS